MTRTDSKKVVVYGFLSWLVPFLASFLFFGRNGQPVLPMGMVKSILLVIGASVGGVLLFRLFKEGSPGLERGIAVGTCWFVMNILLDLAILVPVAKMRIGEYFSEVGLRYLVIPIMAGAMGAVASKRQAA